MNKDNQYLTELLDQLIASQQTVEIFINQNNPIGIHGTVVQHAANDRIMTATLRSFHRGEVKTNIINLNTMVSINYTGNDNGNISYQPE